jgi:flavodoxin
MPSTLIVFYSYTGTSRRVAQLLAAQQGWPVGEIIEEHPRAGAGGTLRCVLDSLLGREPPVRYEGPEPGGFDQVVLVAPVWVYQLAGPMRSFISRYAPRLSHYAVATTMSGSGAENVQSEIARLLRQPPLRTAAFPTRTVEDGSFANALQAFGDALSGGNAPMRPMEYSPRAA